MKKFIISSLLLTLLTACGDNINTTSKEYKKQLLSKIYEENDENAKAEHHRIIAELEKINSGKADDEIKRWEELKGDYEAKAMLKMSEKTKALAEEIRSRKGKGW